MQFGRKSTLASCLLMLLAASPVAWCGQTPDPATVPKLAIVSPKYPKDSHGETVYEIQGKDEKNQPVVPGVLTAPIPIGKLPKPKFPASLKKAKTSMVVDVLGVVTVTGAFIDATLPEDTPPDIARSALETVAKYRLKPATLDGKPVAARMQVEIHYVIR